MKRPLPTEIHLHKKSRMLEIHFEDGSEFKLPVEYLRVYSPSAEVRGHAPGEEKLQMGKEEVNIDKLEQVGAYALKIYFDDGHNSGIYSWDTLYDLGKHHDDYWRDYLNRLASAGIQRKGTPAG